jgi:hypothetical protein
LVQENYFLSSKLIPIVAQLSYILLTKPAIPKLSAIVETTLNEAGSVDVPNSTLIFQEVVKYVAPDAVPILKL